MNTVSSEQSAVSRNPAKRMAQGAWRPDASRFALCATLFGAMLFAASGCARLHYDRSQIGFWDQKVTFGGWGFSMITPYGPFNIGYLSWQRNVDQPQEPAKPSDVGDALKGLMVIPNAGR
jgi:hypothetical protein